MQGSFLLAFAKVICFCKQLIQTYYLKQHIHYHNASICGSGNLKLSLMVQTQCFHKDAIQMLLEVTTI